LKIGWNFKFGNSVVCTILGIERKEYNILALKHGRRNEFTWKTKLFYLFVVYYRSNSSSEYI